VRFSKAPIGMGSQPSTAPRPKDGQSEASPGQRSSGFDLEVA
jgi:hypothetical protein